MEVLFKDKLDPVNVCAKIHLLVGWIARLLILAPLEAFQIDVKMMENQLPTQMKLVLVSANQDMEENTANYNAQMTYMEE